MQEKQAVLARARKAKEILATHRPTLLDRDVKNRLTKIIKEGEKGIPH